MSFSESFRIYCSEKTWLEGEAVEQFKRVAALPGALRGAAFPDLHPGRGIPVGAAFLFDNRICPALIGGDIGCGMTLFALDLAERKFRMERFLRSLTADPEPVLRRTVRDLLVPDGAPVADPAQLLGTVGRGNHFLELLAVEKVVSEEAFARVNPVAQSLFLLIHAGSRGYGRRYGRALPPSRVTV